MNPIVTILFYIMMLLVLIGGMLLAISWIAEGAFNYKPIKITKYGDKLFWKGIKFGGYAMVVIVFDIAYKSLF